MRRMQEAFPLRELQQSGLFNQQHISRFIVIVFCSPFYVEGRASIYRRARPHRGLSRAGTTCAERAVALNNVDATWI